MQQKDDAMANDRLPLKPFSENIVFQDGTAVGAGIEKDVVVEDFVSVSEFDAVYSG